MWNCAPYSTVAGARGCVAEESAGKIAVMASYGALEAAMGDTTGNTIDTQNDIDSTNYLHGDYYRKKTTYFSAVIAVVSITLVAIGFILMVDVISSTDGKTSYLSAKRTPTFSNSPVFFGVNSDTLRISSVSNEYGERDSSATSPYKFLIYSYLVEPYKETTVTLTSLSSGCSYDWQFSSVISGVVAASGTSEDGVIVFTLAGVGEYLFGVSEMCADAYNSHREISETMWVKYVRRELSSLNDVDREEYLDAFHTLWTVSTTEGKILYGDRYKSVKYFATLHNDGGANSVCDEFHGSVGFLNNHMYLSSYLEQSLQLVNPRVALHYMEYSKYFESDAFQKRTSYRLRLPVTSYFSRSYCIV